MRAEHLQPVLERLLATRRASMEDTQGGARRGPARAVHRSFGPEPPAGRATVRARVGGGSVRNRSHRVVSKHVGGNREESRRASSRRRDASDAVLLFDDTEHLFGETARRSKSPDRFPNLTCRPSASATSRTTTASWCWARTIARRSIRSSRASATRLSTATIERLLGRRLPQSPAIPTVVVRGADRIVGHPLRRYAPRKPALRNRAQPP